MKEIYNHYILIQNFNYVPALIRRSPVFRSNYNVTYYKTNIEEIADWYCGGSPHKLYSSRSLHQLAIL